MKCDNLGNFGQKYVIRFGAWEGINFYNSEVPCPVIIPAPQGKEDLAY